MSDHLREIDDIDAEAQITQVRHALQADLGGAAAPAEVAALATVAYERVADGARVRSFLPLLAEREARRVLQEIELLRSA
jgi:hypothetical protein